MQSKVNHNSRTKRMRGMNINTNLVIVMILLWCYEIEMMLALRNHKLYLQACLFRLFLFANHFLLMPIFETWF